MYCRINHAFFMWRLFDFYFVLRTLCAPLGFGLRVIVLASLSCAPCARQLCFGLRGIALAIFCQSSRPPHSCARHFCLFFSFSVSHSSLPLPEQLRPRRMERKNVRCVLHCSTSFNVWSQVLKEGFGLSLHSLIFVKHEFRKICYRFPACWFYSEPLPQNQSLLLPYCGVS